ncbi:MAG: c-type cytochrome [Gammaproteobacteria bacterium]
MTTSRRVGTAVLGLIGAFGLAVVAADPASTEDSAWQPLPDDGSAPALASPLEERGRAVFRQRCIACHGEIPEETIGGPFLPAMPGTQALQARYRGAIPAALAERTDLSAAFVQTVVRNGLNSMPFFRPTEVSAEDLEALSAYLTRQRD